MSHLFTSLLSSSSFLSVFFIFSFFLFFLYSSNYSHTIFSLLFISFQLSNADSLGGNSKTIMVATIRTDVEYYQQTAVTLMYASRAKKVSITGFKERGILLSINLTLSFFMMLYFTLSSLILSHLISSHLIDVLYCTILYYIILYHVILYYYILKSNLIFFNSNKFNIIFR